MNDFDKMMAVLERRDDLHKRVFKVLADDDKEVALFVVLNHMALGQVETMLRALEKNDGNV